MIPGWSAIIGEEDPIPYALPEAFVSYYNRGDLPVVLEFPPELAPAVARIVGDFELLVVTGITSDGFYGASIGLVRYGIGGVILLDYMLLNPAMQLASEVCPNTTDETTEVCTPSMLDSYENGLTITLVDDIGSTITVIEEI